MLPLLLLLLLFVSVAKGRKTIECTRGKCTNTYEDVIYICGAAASGNSSSKGNSVVKSCFCGPAHTCIGRFVSGDFNCQNSEVCIGENVGIVNGQCATNVTCSYPSISCNCGSAAKYCFCESSKYVNMYMSSFTEFKNGAGWDEHLAVNDCHIVYENYGNSLCMTPALIAEIILAIVAFFVIVFFVYRKRRLGYCCRPPSSGRSTSRRSEFVSIMIEEPSVREIDASDGAVIATSVSVMDPQATSDLEVTYMGRFDSSGSNYQSCDSSNQYVEALPVNDTIRMTEPDA